MYWNTICCLFFSPSRKGLGKAFQSLSDDSVQTSVQSLNSYLMDKTNSEKDPKSFHDERLLTYPNVDNFSFRNKVQNQSTITVINLLKYIHGIKVLYMLKHAVSEAHILRIALLWFQFNCFSWKLEGEKAHNLALNEL